MAKVKPRPETPAQEKKRVARERALQRQQLDDWQDVLVQDGQGDISPKPASRSILDV